MRSFQPFLRSLALVAITSAAVWGIGCADNTGEIDSDGVNSVDDGTGMDTATDGEAGSVPY